MCGKEIQSTILIKDTLGPRILSFIEGFAECTVKMFGTNSSVHYKECPLLRVSVKKEFIIIARNKKIHNNYWKRYVYNSM